MLFLKRTVPLAICFLFGIVFLIQYFVPHRASQELLTTVNDWMLVISGFAMFLGIGSLFLQHAERIRRQVAGWGYSAVMFAGFLVMVVTGVLARGKTSSIETGQQTAFGWTYLTLFVPLSGTMFALLG
ncbi:MAG: hypothetical protein HY608_10980, partial [Planctomycetes bacterium]|nr:hypothetical protein [Planctomycetota bacterium]